MEFRKKIIFFLCLIFLSGKCFGQNSAGNEFKFGFQLRPIVPNSYLNTVIETSSLPNFTYSAKANVGISFGAIIRKPLGKFWNLETGLNFVKRSYTLNYHLTDTVDVRSTQNMTFIAYEIPIQALIYVRLGKSWYMNASAGISLDFFPSETETFSSEKLDSTYYDFKEKTYRIKWSALAAQSNLGFEYRTEKKGYYYLGASFHRPFGRIAGSEAIVESTAGSDRLWLSLSGSYFSIDLKFFPYDKYKTKKAVTE
jgi:hypothetical protein